MCKVSIIVPIYKVERYLRECIDSVLNQTYRDFELILVDDGSPDNCGLICDDYAGKDSRIRVIHKSNEGVSSARNAGLDIAVGKYVYFLDSDDMIESNLLETVVLHMENGADMVAFTLRGFFDNGTKLPPYRRETGSYLLQTPEARVSFIHNTLLQAKIGWEACLRIFSREIIEQYGLRFADRQEVFAEDLYFNLCYCAHVERVLSLPDCLYCYRKRSDSFIASQNQKCNIGYFYALTKELEVYYRQFEDCKLLVDDFSLLRYQLLVEQFSYQLWISGMTPREFRKATIAGISDWDILKKEICENLRRDVLKPYYNDRRNSEIKCHVRFWLGMPWFAFRVQWKIIHICWAAKDAFKRLEN